ncbi:MAG: phospho-N-acetylmuramoyl-pentapeptide-transferase [Caldithrix sp.]|nr:phospho-N-acetylmuramoyl-pentapeptide-transferase [Caldithrix sp.]
MLWKFLYQFSEWFFGFNVFRYITVRATLAAITALFIALVIGPKIIALLKKHQIGEEIRIEGPDSHQKKKGTPTMGGLIILMAVGISTLLWAEINNMYFLIIFVATMILGVVGYIDDYMKSVLKLQKGLIAKYKLTGQLGLGLIIGLIIYFHPYFEGLHSNSSVPFFKNLEIDFGIFYIPVIIFIVAGASNAVNLTDGLDGLAAGLSAVAFIAMAGIAYVSSHVKFSDYLNIIYLPGSQEVAVFCLALFGAAIGFLWYNAYPAQVFMGDTGSLALGGALGTAAVLLKKELLLILIGGIFIFEVLSVIIQTTYFKYTKRKYGEGQRIFRMAPIHHHFELKGWHEAKVVVRFWIIGILLALLSLSTFKTQ